VRIKRGSQTGLFSVEFLNLDDKKFMMSEMLAVGIEVNLFVDGSAIPWNFHSSVCQRNFLVAGKRISVFRKRNTKKLQGSIVKIPTVCPKI
jgi:hypothetical protein